MIAKRRLKINESYTTFHIEYVVQSLRSNKVTYFTDMYSGSHVPVKR